VTSSWFFLATLNYDARSATQQVCTSGFAQCRYRDGQTVPQVAVGTFALILNDACRISSGSEPDPEGKGFAALLPCTLLYTNIKQFPCEKHENNCIFRKSASFLYATGKRKAIPSHA